MKLLVDMNLSPNWIAHMKLAGLSAVHWSDVGRADAPDSEIMAYAMGLLNRLVERAKAGEFVPNRSLAELPTKSASSGSPTRAAVNGSGSLGSQPRLTSEIAEQTLSKWRPKRAPGAE